MCRDLDQEGEPRAALLQCLRAEQRFALRSREFGQGAAVVGPADDLVRFIDNPGLADGGRAGLESLAAPDAFMVGGGEAQGFAQGHGSPLVLVQSSRFNVQSGAARTRNVEP